MDSGLYAGYRIPTYYDSLIGKLIAHGRDRDECVARVRRALEETVIEGVETTIPLFEDLLKEPDFISGTYDIHWLEHWIEATTDGE
jgi:acetyl-CoA carboxylase biotin carboxylase subunit